MKIGIFSDLHLQHWKRHFVESETIINWILEETKDCDVVINAGDTEFSLKPIFKMNRPHTKYIEVKGNHDYYDGLASDILSPEDMGTVDIDGYKIAWAPLWTPLDHPLDDVNFFQFSDSKWISGFLPDIWRQAHQNHFKFLSESGADIIVTHHAPFSSSIHEDYKFDDFNCFFNAKIDYKIYQFKKKPMMWAHGHVHNKFNYVHDDILVVCNPFGYYFEPNHKNYKIKKIEIQKAET